MDRLSLRFSSGSGESDVDVDQDNSSSSEVMDLDQLGRGKPTSSSQDATETDEDSIDTAMPQVDTTDAQSTTQTIQPSRPSKLFALPQELFDEIVKYLGPAHIVCLALADKELFRRFLRVHGPPPLDGQEAGSETQPSPELALTSASWKILGQYVRNADALGNKAKVRNTLLSLIDSDILNLVYCYKCKKLHDPFITFIDRAYVPKKAAKCVDYAFDHHMPPRATRKLLRTITKTRKQGVPYQHLMQQVNNTSTVYKNGIVVQLSLRMRYRGDSLLLRRQQVVSSMDKTALALYLFTQQLKFPAPGGLATTTSPIVHKICNHFTWNTQYATTLNELIDGHCQADKSSSQPQPDEHRHSPNCFTKELYDAAKDEGSRVFRRFEQVKNGTRPETKPNSSDYFLGEIHGCDRCTTDFSMDVISLPEPFHWGFILTTWLDLGTVDFCPKWDSHREVRPGRVFARQPSEFGDICRSFESIDSIAQTHYTATIRDLDLERMDNYGWGRQAAQGKNKYISWSTGHCPDPSTGMIADPDPLEPDDLSG